MNDLFMYRLGQKRGGGGSGGGSGGGETVEKDVKFYDYDGTLVESWSLAELSEKTELPAMPKHEGLVAQEWNWTLEDLKSECAPTNVGALYTTDDGKTRIYVTLTDDLRSPVLRFKLFGTVDVDWGDGTQHDTLTGSGMIKTTPNHEYAAAGDYVITLDITDGKIVFLGCTDGWYGQQWILGSADELSVKSTYASVVRKIEFGSKAVRLEGQVFRCLGKMREVSFSNSVDVAGISNYAFSELIVKHFSIPGSDSFAVIPNNCFAKSCWLRSVALPKGINSIGDYAFQECYALDSVTIPSSVTSLGGSAFAKCGILDVVIPRGITSIASYEFQNCYGLQNVAINGAVTSIGAGAFSLCSRLSSVTFPNSVSEIASSAFFGCYAVEFFDFSKHTAVPTLANSTVFSSITVPFEIRVPAALVDEWKAATNWSTYADKIVGV